MDSHQEIGKDATTNKEAAKKVSSLIQGTRKMRRIAKALTRRNQKSKLVEINQALYERAFREKLFILGPKDKNGIDWTMYDYALAIPAIYNECMTPQDYIKAFWNQLYPHIDKVLEEYQDAVANHNATIGEVDEMMIKYVDMMQKFKIMEEFIDNKKFSEEFKEYEEKRNKEIEEATPRKDVPESSAEEA